MIFGNAVARHNEPHDRLAEECVKRRLLIVGVVSGGTAEGHARTTCLVIGRSAHVEQGLQDGPSAPQTARSLWRRHHRRPRIVREFDQLTPNTRLPATGELRAIGFEPTLRQMAEVLPAIERFEGRIISGGLLESVRQAA